MTSALIFIFAVAFSNLDANAQAKSIGADGEVERVTGINNRALQFGSEAEQWKKKYPLEKLKRGPNGETNEDIIAYCLRGGNDGEKLAERGDDVSTEYGSYMMESRGNAGAGVVSAFTNQAGNVKGLNSEIKKRNEAARCK